MRTGSGVAAGLLSERGTRTGCGQAEEPGQECYRGIAWLRKQLEEDRRPITIPALAINSRMCFNGFE